MGKPKLGKGLAALTAVPAVLSTKESAEADEIGVRGDRKCKV